MKLTTLKPTIAALLVPAVLLMTSPVMASERHGSIDLETKSEIQASLLAQGYEVRRVVRENGLFEAYVIKDGRLMEIYLDRDMNVVRIKRRN